MACDWGVLDDGVAELGDVGTALGLVLLGLLTPWLFTPRPVVLPVCGLLFSSP